MVPSNALEQDIASYSLHKLQDSPMLSLDWVHAHCKLRMSVYCCLPLSCFLNFQSLIRTPASGTCLPPCPMESLCHEWHTVRLPRQTHYPQGRTRLGRTWRQTPYTRPTVLMTGLGPSGLVTIQPAPTENFSACFCDCLYQLAAGALAVNDRK